MFLKNQSLESKRYKTCLAFLIAHLLIHFSKLTHTELCILGIQTSEYETVEAHYELQIKLEINSYKFRHRFHPITQF